MRWFFAAIMCVFLLSAAACDWQIGTGLSPLDGPAGLASTIIDHRHASVDGLTEVGARSARENLRIVYWHTSHGSQLSTGMAEMDHFFGDRGWYLLGGEGGLAYDDRYEADLGNPDRDAFEATTRNYLAEHPDTNVVMWSWCGQVSSASEADIQNYLDRMSSLERDFPAVRFVYMTGHADGSGESGNLHLRNRQIRSYCESNNKFLYDFYDIECYDPDGNYYGDRNVDDGCNYDGGNWAHEWQGAHPGQWWECSSAHSEPLNANRKAMAAWQLFVSLAGNRL